jgi:hypothetical protein
MEEPQDTGKYQVDNDGTVQGQVIGDHNKVEVVDRQQVCK